jgi:hypothetical protein
MRVKLKQNYLINKGWTDIDSNKLYEVRNKYIGDGGRVTYYVHVPFVPVSGLVPERARFIVKQWLYSKEGGPQPINDRLPNHIHISEHDLEEAGPMNNMEAKSFLLKEG